MHQSAIYLNNLLKNFQGVAVVDNVSFMIEKGKPLEFRRGHSQILMGEIFQDATLDGKFGENLYFHVRLHSMGRDVRRKRIDNVLDIVDMREIEPFDDPISKWRYMRQRS